MKKPLYLAGEWITTKNSLDVTFPYTGEVINTVCLASSHEMDLAIQKAYESKKTTEKLTPYQRADILRYIVTQLENRHEEFSQLLTLENGKTITEARLEISRCVTTFQIAIGEAERIYGESYDLAVNDLSVNRHAIVKKFPIGVVAGIAPFNFPMNLAAHKIAPAIASGCPIIIKPASATPLTMLLFAEIIESSGWPKKAFSVLPCDRVVGQQLVEDDRIALLSFTGSPHVGWKMKEQAKKKKVVLELGGNAAVIIDTNISDWDHVINRSILGAYYQAGQVCISVQRIFVHEDIALEFKKRFIEATKKIAVGDPRKEETFIGGIIDEKNKERIQSWVDEAIETGATCLVGNESDGTLFFPTLLENVQDGTKLAEEEVFGTVAILETFTSIEEVISQVNDSKFGLQVGIFTDSQKTLWKIFNEIEVGGVVHDDVPSFRSDMMPYWWVKDSGLGREGIKYAMEDMLEPRVLVLKIK